MRIHFVLDPRATRWDDIERLDAASIERDPRRFVGGRNSWIAQTYVRLRAALAARGLAVSAGARFVPGALCVAHRDDLDRFASDAHASFIVAVRADRAPVEACDVAIAQNSLALRGNERYLPLWPQPGLRPRDARRDDRVENVAYMGRTSSSPSWLRNGLLAASLARLGVALHVRERAWHDYADIDVALAVRDEAPAVLATKPATKLYNGWLAGVPVIATPEPAYRELRAGPLDFVEVTSAEEIVRAIASLRADPRLYREMRAHGLARGREFDVHAVAARWLRLFDHELLPAFASWRQRNASRRRWFVGAMLVQKAESRLHRAAVSFQRRIRAPIGPLAALRPGLRAASHVSPGGD
jgi:hypothetical protein